MATEPDPAAWGLPDFSFEPLSGGARNIVLLARGPGIKVVFKTTRRCEDQMRWLLEVVPWLRSAGLEIAMPMETSDGALTHAGWTVEPFVPGRALTIPDMGRFRQTLLRLQGLACGMAQRPGFASAGELMSAHQSADFDLYSMPIELLARCRAAWSQVPGAPLTLCHGDLNPSNLAITPWGQFVIYDWDEARIDHPLFDLVAIGALDHATPRRAALAYEIAACWNLERERAMSLAKEL
ncbi:MAG: aminoglycoside phosphotransferase family protein [Marinovum sp.]|nr:aminoglycoside phosphotransferase family protein [Marinovum sp.]